MCPNSQTFKKEKSIGTEFNKAIKDVSEELRKIKEKSIRNLVEIFKNEDYSKLIIDAKKRKELVCLVKLVEHDD